MALPPRPTAFVRLWLSNKPTLEIASDYGVSLSTVTQWAANFRAAGVDLPSRQWAVRRRENLDVVALNEVIKQSGR